MNYNMMSKDALSKMISERELADPETLEWVDMIDILRADDKRKNEPGFPQTPDAGVDQVLDPDEREVTVIFIDQMGPGGTDDVVFAINGKVYQAKRNVEIKLKKKVLDVLRQRTQTVYVQNEETREVFEKEIPRFALQVLG